MYAKEICPNCGAVNEKLDLRETDGLYVCCRCQTLVDTKSGCCKPPKNAETENGVTGKNN